jgi:hypothetical protein
VGVVASSALPEATACDVNDYVTTGAMQGQLPPWFGCGIAFVLLVCVVAGVAAAVVYGVSRMPTIQDLIEQNLVEEEVPNLVHVDDEEDGDVAFDAAGATHHDEAGALLEGESAADVAFDAAGATHHDEAGALLEGESVDASHVSPQGKGYEIKLVIQDKLSQTVHRLDISTRII